MERRIAFVLGGASCVFEDAAKAFELALPDIVIAVNDVMAYFPGKIDVAATLHPKYLSSKRWIPARVSRGFPDIPRVFSYAPSKYVTDIHDFKWPEMTFSGSSGHYGVKIALDVFECSHVICCGIPMTATPHIYDNSAWGDVVRFWDQWELSRARMWGKVKSMSGRTADLLGKPDGEWLWR